MSNPVHFFLANYIVALQCAFSRIYVGLGGGSNGDFFN